MRIAVASTDGKVVNQHFGRARSFLIFEVRPEGWEFIEERESPPVCGSARKEGDQSASERVFSTLSDCQAVVCAQAGLGMKNHLATRGIRLLEMPYFIEDALKEIQKDLQLKVV